LVETRVVPDVVCRLCRKVLTVFHNCRLYNADGSAIVRMADTLSLRFLGVLKAHAEPHLTPRERVALTASMTRRARRPSPESNERTSNPNSQLPTHNSLCRHHRRRIFIVMPRRAKLGWRGLCLSRRCFLMRGLAARVLCGAALNSRFAAHEKKMRAWWKKGAERGKLPPDPPAAAKIPPISKVSDRIRHPSARGDCFSFHDEC
jgi:hypothetical protein